MKEQLKVIEEKDMSYCRHGYYPYYLKFNCTKKPSLLEENFKRIKTKLFKAV